MATPFPMPPPGMVPPGMFPPGPPLGPGGSPGPLPGLSPGPFGAPAGGLPLPPPAPPMAPPPPPAPPTPPDPVAELASMLTAMVEAMGEEAVAEQLAVLPGEMVDELREVAKNDPLLVDVLLPLLPEEDRRPAYEAWFAALGPPPKPDRGTILELAERDRTYYEALRTRRERWLNLYNQEWDLVGRFKHHDDAKDELFLDTALSDQINALIARGGAIDPAYDVPILKPDLRDEGQKAEDVLMWCDRQEARRHRDRSGAVLRREEWAYLVLTGMVCWSTMLDPDDTDYFFQDRLHDPNAVFPFWDDRGLLRVTTVTQATVADVIRRYDRDGKVRRKILGARKGETGGQTPTGADEFYRHEDWMKLVCYYDRWWYACYADGIEVVAPVAHRYGVVPWVVQGTSLGDPTGMLAPGQLDAGGIDAAQTRIAHKHVSPIAFWDRSHVQWEAMMGPLKTIVSRLHRPDWIWYHDYQAKGEGTPTVEQGGNKVTPLLKDHEELQMLVEKVDLSALGPLMQTSQQNRQTNQGGAAQAGINPGANASGNAIEGLAESGRDVHEAPLIQAMEAFHAAKATMRLRFLRDWGHLLRTAEDGDYGVLTIPHAGDRRRRDGLPPAFELAPEMLDRVGIAVEAHLTSVQMRNLGPLGAAVGQWLGTGTMSRREAIAMRGHPDPDDVIDEIDYEEVLMDPEIKKAQRLKLLRQRDPDAYQIVRELLATQNAGPGAAPTPAASFAPTSTAGVNLPAIGQGQVGPTGRPPLAVPPPPPPGSVAIPPGGTDVGP